MRGAHTGGPCSKLCQSSNFISTDPCSYIHIPSKLHIFLANSSAISPLSGISILGLVPSVPGNLSASHLSLRVGTFARQSSAFGAPTYRGQFGSRSFPEVLLSKDTAEASPDVSNASCLSLSSLPELGSPSIVPVLYLSSFRSMDLKDL